MPRAVDEEVVKKTGVNLVNMDRVNSWYSSVTEKKQDRERAEALLENEKDKYEKIVKSFKEWNTVE